jgi:hypothetical protein
MPPNIYSDQEQAGWDEDEYDVVQLVQEQTLILPEEIAEQGQDNDPYSCSKAGKQAEQAQVHAGQSGRQGNVLPDSWDQAADKGTDMTVAGKKYFGSGQGPFCDEKVAAMLDQKGSTSGYGQPVIEHSPKQAAQGSAGNNHPQPHCPLGGQVSGRWDHHFARKGKERRFQEHEKSNSWITPLADGLDQPMDKGFKHRLGISCF